MPTISAVAFNTGSTIPGTTQIGNLSIGNSVLDYRALGNQYGVTYYATPDQDLGYVIGYPDIFAGHLGKPNDVPAKIGFFRSSGLTESSFIITAQYVTQMIGNPQTFLSGIAAKTWLNTNGFWTSYPTILTNGLVMYVDAANSSSYPGSSQPGPAPKWYDISGGATDMSFVLDPNYWRIGNSYPVFDSIDGGGSWVFDSRFTPDIRNAGGTPNSLTNFIAPTRGITLSVWIKLDSFNSPGIGDSSIIYITQPVFYTVNINASIQMYTSNSIQDIYISCDNTFLTQAGICQFGCSSSDLNQWRYLTFSIDCSSSGLISTYKNGILQNTSTLTVSLNLPSAVLILSGYAQYARGSIAKYGSIQTYNKILSPSEILYNYNVDKARFGL